jgi:NurA domain
MGYSSKGRKPIERASKIAHGEIINNPDVVAYLQACTLPSAPEPFDIRHFIHPASEVDVHSIRAVIAIDGGFTETYVREEFPSASLTFFTFGPLFFRLSDLRVLDNRRFIAPEDLATLKKLERYTLTIPTRGIRQIGESTLASSIRRTIYEFFIRSRGPAEESLIKTLAWFLFRRWEMPPDDSREEILAHCPNTDCDAADLRFHYDSPIVFQCPSCGRPVYLTDVFRLHERIDEEQGAGGILTYIITLLEQVVLVHMIRTIWQMKRTLLREILFLKDGPLGFFGLVAPLYKPMRELTRFLLYPPPSDLDGRRSYLYLAGIEKSGVFVDHAAAIERYIPPGSIMIPDNDYIYRYIVPGDPAAGVYGHNTYYGSKVFYKSSVNDMYVLTIPTGSHPSAPRPSDFPNLNVLLHLVAQLRCHMYDNALIPIALANKLVSLSDFPSQRILTEFARGELA